MNTEPQISKRCRGLSEPTPTAFLPEDVIGLIISWLRVKPLMKMKCVSKSFNTLICDPKFVKMHLNRSKRNRLSYLVSYKDDFKEDDDSSIASSFANNSVPAEDDYSFVPFSVADLPENPILGQDDPYYRLIDKDCRKVVGSCNGLVCLLGSSELQTWFRFWNPATRTISDKLGLLHNDEYEYKLTDWRFTFGYDNSTDTYKVVALCLGKENDRYETVVLVLNFGENIWRSILTIPAKPFQVVVSPKISRGCNGVHLKGTVNWLAIGSGGIVIISLDLSTETYKTFSIPQFISLEELTIAPHLCVMMDNLYLYHDINKTDFIIWCMTKFGDDKSWTRKPLLNSDQVRRMKIKYHLFSCFNLYLNRGILVFLKDDEAILYNIRTGDPLKSIVNKKICWFSMNNYVESLVSTH